MNVNEFAERVVFGTTLEDKLLDPGALTYCTERFSSRSLDSVATPGRSAGLEMQHGPNAAQPPSDALLENEYERGRLLHFLANHELLATELMALVLLKFPDAPHAFRQGVLVTLREEQEHTRLYLQRMKECGVEFGSFPLSGQFWRLVEPMQSPLDFVSRLSLTFEQANLDYSLHFSNVFRQIGDTQTATILHQIYKDEIGHVQHGLHWFRQWKNPEHSDWEAYRESLTFPMSPQRARGPRGSFNRAGRLEAGLSIDFVDAIEVFRQSRGRTPNVWWFDPAAEAELARPLSTRENHLMNQLGKDLECVMIPLAKQDDIVLVRSAPSLDFRKQLLARGFQLPEFVGFNELSTLQDRKIHHWLPWARTPANDQIAKRFDAEPHRQQPAWQDSHADLFRKSWSADRLRVWTADDARFDWFTSSQTIGVSVSSVDDVKRALAQLGEKSFSHAIFKQDLATSGRGQRRLPCRNRPSEQDLDWIRSVLTNGEVGVVEPELDRVLDLSFLWHFSPSSSAPEFTGWTRPLVTSGRRYAGTRLGRPFSDCDKDLKRFLLENHCGRLRAVQEWLESHLASEFADRRFYGYFGVDAIVCRDSLGELKIKPFVELNPRITMGHVAQALEKFVAPGVFAEFRIFSRPEWEKLYDQLNSIPFEKSGDGRWMAGVVWLGESDSTTKLFPAVVLGELAMATVWRG